MKLKEKVNTAESSGDLMNPLPGLFWNSDEEIFTGSRHEKRSAAGLIEHCRNAKAIKKAESKA